MDDHGHLRLEALQRRVRELEEHMRQVHVHLGLGIPERPAPEEGEVEAVRRLLTEGKETEALRLHQDLTGQGVEESRDALESLRAGF